MNSWIAYPAYNPTLRLRLLCFPPAAAGASIYRAWSASLPAAIEVCPVQLPGRENRLAEPPFTALRELVETVAPVIRPHLDVPFAIFGHSMGALIGFELARELRRAYQLHPIHLFVAARQAPQHTKTLSQSSYQLSSKVLSRRLLLLGGTPKETLRDPELRQLVVSLLRSDLQMCENYIYYEEEPFDCPITVFGGVDDQTTGHDDLAGWAEHTRDLFSAYMLPGGHFFPQSERLTLLRTIFAELTASLERAEQ